MTIAKLGFGTSQLMGRIGQTRSLRLMEVAFAAGIRHFDTAPLYGLGAAEQMVGKFAKTKRSEITVATKFGIKPPRNSLRLRVAKIAARAMVKTVPSLRVQFRRRAEFMTSHGHFNPEACRESLKASLQYLQTDRVDFFLMHEIDAQQLSSELLHTLEDLVRSGCVGAFGVATSAAAAATIAPMIPNGSVAQFPSNAFNPTVNLIPDNTSKITHSSLGDEFIKLHKHLLDNSSLLTLWSRKLDFDCSDSDQLGRLFIYSAMVENAGGTVIFSSANEGRIERNAALAHGSELSISQVNTLRTLLDERSRVHPIPSKEI